MFRFERAVPTPIHPGDTWVPGSTSAPSLARVGAGTESIRVDSADMPDAAAFSAGLAAVLIVISMQPPNEIALPITVVMTVGLISLWFGWMRHYFRRSQAPG